MHFAPVAKHLPHRFVHGRWRWWLAAPTLEDAAVQAAETFTAPESVERAGRLIKRQARRLVYRVPGPDDHEALIKAFAHPSLTASLRWRRYAPHEAVTQLIARSRGVTTPAVLGLGRQRGRIGLASAGLLMMQYVPDRVPLQALLRSEMPEANGDAGNTPPPPAPEALLAAVRPVFVQLYAAGCGHPDMSPVNVLVSASSPTGSSPTTQPMVIDFRGARFRRTPSVNWLMFQAGCFAERAIFRCGVTAGVLDDWAAALLRDADVPRARHAEAMSRFRFYRAHRLPRGRRYRVRP